MVVLETKNNLDKLKELVGNLENTERLFGVMWEFAPVGMAIVSGRKEDHLPFGTIIKANPTLCKMLGYNVDELEGMTFQEITHPDDIEYDLDMAKSVALSNIQRYAMRKRYIHKEGHDVKATLFVSGVADSEGNFRYFLSVINDFV